MALAALLSRKGGSPMENKVERINVSKVDLLLWRQEWLKENDPYDGTDCVTPFDKYLYGGGETAEISTDKATQDFLSHFNKVFDDLRPMIVKGLAEAIAEHFRREKLKATTSVKINEQRTDQVAMLYSMIFGEGFSGGGFVKDIPPDDEIPAILPREHHVSLKKRFVTEEEIAARAAAIRGRQIDEEPRVPHNCNMGVGCEESGVCYAQSQGQPDRCGHPDGPKAQSAAKSCPVCAGMRQVYVLDSAMQCPACTAEASVAEEQGDRGLLKPVAWMYEHDGLVHNVSHPPVFTAARWPSVNEPWTETELCPLNESQREAIKQVVRNYGALKEIIYSGLTVYDALDEKARQRTSADNISDVLDAIVRLFKQQRDT